jgi:DNA modification methylase
MQIVKINEVKPNPKNPRLIKDEKFKKLVKSIQEFPDMLNKRPLIVFTDVDSKYVVLGGNMRLKACKEVGIKEIPVIVADEWTEEQKAQFLIKDNVGFGEWDWDGLANEWDVEKLEDWGLDLPVDLSVVEELEAEEDNYEIPNEINTDIVLGDLFEIGEHRLLCGDSTCSDTVAKLMNGEKADMVFTDPPYGINVVADNGTIGKEKLAKAGIYSKVIGDETTDTARDFYNTCIALGMKDFIIWGGNYFTDFLPFSSSWIIWDKRGDMNSNNFADGEMAWCSFHTRVRIYKQVWAGMIREDESEKRVHPTQKPVRTLVDIIQDQVKGNIIYDGFLGSGSTMVAAYQLKRKCYGMELDPKYCQVIIDRMKKLDPSLEIKRNGETVK